MSATSNNWAIEQTRRFYGPRRTVTLVLTQSGGVLEGTKAEMIREIKTQDSAIHHMDANESCRPDLRPVKVGGRRYNAAMKRMGM
jgi:hypothetical protein